MKAIENLREMAGSIRFQIEWALKQGQDKLSREDLTEMFMLASALERGLEGIEAAGQALSDFTIS